MFDTTELGRLTGGQLLRLAASNHQAVIEAENQAVMIAAAWADDQDRDPADEYAPLIHRSSEAGGAGTPAVSEFAAAELGAVLGVGIGSGRALIADALDLRHRLPLAWSRLCAGHIRAWQARKVAQATRWLGVDEAGEVDAAVSGFLGAMPWPRFERILGAAIPQADPEAVAERAERARTERMVRAFDSDDGLRTVVARATSGDVAWFMATVNRIADILELDGSSDTVDVRRSRAIGILAQPALALKMLIAHRDDPDRPPNPPEPLARRGHTPARPSVQTEPAQTEPGQTEPAQTEPGQTEPAQTEPGQTEPGQTEPGQTEPGQTEPGRTEPGWLDLIGQAEPLGRTDSANDDADAFDRPGSATGDSADLSPDDPGEAEDARRGLLGHSTADAELVAAVDRLDAATLRPRVVLHFHLAEAALSEVGALIRPEQGPALSLDQLHEFLSDTGCRVTVRPVVTPADQAPVDGYEIPHRIREAVRLRNLVDVFPYASCASAGMDLDHTVAYRPGGPPGQTGLHNLGPLSRTSHRHATPGVRAGGHWRKRQPDPGTFLWRSPHGWTYLVTADGTLNLGTTAFARAVWASADPEDAFGAAGAAGAGGVRGIGGVGAAGLRGSAGFARSSRRPRGIPDPREPRRRPGRQQEGRSRRGHGQRNDLIGST